MRKHFQDLNMQFEGRRSARISQERRDDKEQIVKPNGRDMPAGLCCNALHLFRYVGGRRAVNLKLRSTSAV